jgi:hypothetical protein
MLPHVLLTLPENELAFIFAAIDLRAKAEAKAIRDAKKK